MDETNVDDIRREMYNSDVYRTCRINATTMPGHCPRTFDEFLYTVKHSQPCWPETPAGKSANLSCPKIPLLGFETGGLAFRKCLENGSWFRIGNVTWTNLSQCMNHQEFEFLQYINKLHVIGYSISLVALILSVWIFITFRSLRCTRIRIHTQLFISFILNNILWIAWYERVIPDTDLTKLNPIWCQILHISKEYFMMANYMWMLCEGLHLHLALVVVFVREERTIKWFFALGWGTPVLIVMIHSLVRLYITEDTYLCWLEESSFSTWFISVPVVFILLLCTIFLINVLRVILTIMHPNSPNPAPIGIRRAARAALILIPLFGLQFILLPMVPGQDHPLYHFYLWLCVIIVPLQGLCCACLFCFANQDVHQAMKSFTHRWLHHNARWDGYQFAGTAAESAGVYVVNGSQSHRRSTDMTKL